MKKVKIIAAVIMCAVMLLAAAGCNLIDPDNKAIVGTWTSDPVDLAYLFNDAMQDGLPDDIKDYLTISSFEINIVFTFTDDGKYTMSADEESVQAAVENMEAELSDGVCRYYSDFAEDNGITVDELAQANDYENIDALVADTLSGFDFNGLRNDIIGPIECSDGFVIRDGQLFLLVEEENGYSDVFNYTLEGDKLTLEIPAEYADEYDFDFPSHFTR